MIVLDTSAIMAILLGEADAASLQERIRSEGEVIVSAGTVVELLAVTSHGDGELALAKRFLQAPFVQGIEPVTESQAFLAGEAYRKFGRGHGSARLNLGDMFAYALAKDKGLPLLFKGNDFTHSDIEPA